MAIDSLREPNPGDTIRVVCPDNYAPLYSANGERLGETAADGTTATVCEVKEINDQIYYRISNQDVWIPKSFTNWGRPEVVERRKKETESHSVTPLKTKSHKGWWITALIIIIVVCGAVALSQNSQSQTSKVVKHEPQSDLVKVAKKMGRTSANKLTDKDIAAIALAYSNRKDEGSDLGQTYEQAKTKPVTIAKADKYKFGDYQVSAPQKGAVYVLSRQTGYVVTNLTKPEKADLVFVNDQGRRKLVSLLNAAKLVNKEDLTPISQNIVFTNKLPVAKTKKKTAKKTKTNVNSLAWNSTKEKALANYMVTFGKMMQQKYVEYRGSGNLKTSAGQEYPAIFQKTPFMLNGKRISISWDPQLKQNVAYHVVSIFNYNRGSVEFHITYLFCIYNNQPVVLCDQTTNGSNVVVTITKNKILSENFAKIARG